jgi:hypothetical protein
VTRSGLILGAVLSLVVRPDPPLAGDPYRCRTAAEAFGLAANGHRVTLFVGVPDVLAGRLRFHFAARAGAFGLAAGVYDLIGSAGSGRPVEVRRVPDYPGG